MAKYKSIIDTSGPFFKNDPGKTFRQNVRTMMAAFAAEGEADVQGGLQHGQAAREPVSSGVSPARVSQHVVGRPKSLGGKPWAVTAVVSVNNQGLSKAQGIALMAAASTLEGSTRAFRKTTNRLRRARSINKAELLKGING